MKIVVKKIEKRYRHHRVLQNISFELSTPDSLVITGPNGSGKTTLVKILCGLATSSSGEAAYFHKKKKLLPAAAYPHIGLVGPYLQLYKDLTAWENFSFFAKARTGNVDKNRLLSLLETVGLKGRQHDALKNYSSGMLQRAKYVAALYHRPTVLILDEPTANLDKAGKKMVADIITQQKQEGIVIIATNEPEEIAFANRRVDVA